MSKEIDGIIYNTGSKIVKNKERNPLRLDDIPFVYKNFKDMNQILYYESTRGCPYQCGTVYLR